MPLCWLNTDKVNGHQESLEKHQNHLSEIFPNTFLAKLQPADWRYGRKCSDIFPHFFPPSKYSLGFLQCLISEFWGICLIWYMAVLSQFFFYQPVWTLFELKMSVPAASCRKKFHSLTNTHGVWSRFLVTPVSFIWSVRVLVLERSEHSHSLFTLSTLLVI